MVMISSPRRALRVRNRFDGVITSIDYKFYISRSKARDSLWAKRQTRLDGNGKHQWSAYLQGRHWRGCTGSSHSTIFMACLRVRLGGHVDAE